MVMIMSCKIGDLRNKQVVCIKSGCVLGFVSDVELNTETGNLESIIIFGRPKLLGVFGKEDDIVIPWSKIEVIGNETILVNIDASPYLTSENKTKKLF